MVLFCFWNQVNLWLLYYHSYSEVLPFLAVWSWQFSKVQGPQAPHEDTSHSTGQLMWQSWVVFGGIPRHRSLSIGRSAVETQTDQCHTAEMILGLLHTGHTFEGQCLWSLWFEQQRQQCAKYTITIRECCVCCTLDPLRGRKFSKFLNLNASVWWTAFPPGHKWIPVRHRRILHWTQVLPSSQYRLSCLFITR